MNDVVDISKWCRLPNSANFEWKPNNSLGTEQCLLSHILFYLNDLRICALFTCFPFSLRYHIFSVKFLPKKREWRNGEKRQAKYIWARDETNSCVHTHTCTDSLSISYDFFPSTDNTHMRGAWIWAKYSTTCSFQRSFCLNSSMEFGVGHSMPRYSKRTHILQVSVRVWVFAADLDFAAARVHILFWIGFDKSSRDPIDLS